MIVQTSRFGSVEVDEGRTISFARGILGFPKYREFVLIQGEPDSTFYWLQSVDAADLAFVVTDPLLFVPDYQIPLREETRQDLGISDLAEANVLVIVNKVGDTLTANLQGPLVIHAGTRAAAQIVIKQYVTTRVLRSVTYCLITICAAPARCRHGSPAALAGWPSACRRPC